MIGRRLEQLPVPSRDDRSNANAPPPRKRYPLITIGGVELEARAARALHQCLIASLRAARARHGDLERLADLFALVPGDEHATTDREIP